MYFIQKVSDPAGPLMQFETETEARDYFYDRICGSCKVDLYYGEPTSWVGMSEEQVAEFDYTKKIEKDQCTLQDLNCTACGCEYDVWTDETESGRIDE